MGHIRRLVMGTTVFLACGASPALASVHVWNGSVGNGLWSSANNWTPSGVPASAEAGGTIVEFDGSTTSTMDVTGLTVDQIHFKGTANSISATKTLGLSGATLVTNILDESGGNTLSAPIAMTGAAIVVDVKAGTSTLSGQISGPQGLVFRGSGTSGATLTANNTYTGTTSVQSGTLQLNSNGVDTAVSAGSLVIGSVGAPSATLQLDQSSEIPNSTSVQVLAGGTFKVAPYADLIGQLSVTDGQVSLGAGGLTDGGALTMTGGTISGASNGSGLSLKGDVTATSSLTGTAMINANVTLNGARTFTVTPGPQTSGDLTIGGPIADGISASSLTKAGAGTMNLNAATADTYTGATAVQAGVVTTTHAAGVGIPGSVTVGTGAGAPSSAQLRMLNSSELASTGAVTVDQDGLLDLGAFSEVVGALTLNGGDVTMSANGSLALNAVSMTGGSIAGGRLTLNPQSGNAPTVTATSSPQGPAAIASGVMLNANATTITVASGTAPELDITGAIAASLPADTVTKAGAGTLLSTANSTYTGATTVSGGTFIANGQQTGPFAVGPNGALAGDGAVGGLTVAGLLEPAHGLSATSLSFGATSRLDEAISSGDPAMAPTITATGPVSIDPAAVLNVQVSPGLSLPHGTALPLISNTGSGPISGTFATPPIATPEGIALVPSYAALDGNDLALIAANVPPVAGPVSATPASGVTGQPLTFAVNPSDANHDSLTTTWDFGDGTTGTGSTTAHSYAAAGKYHVVATVSDGVAQVQAGADVTVIPAPVGTGTNSSNSGNGSASGAGGNATGGNATGGNATGGNATGGSGSGARTTAASQAYGATFTVARPPGCVHAGKPFKVTLSIKRATGAHAMIRAVAKVVFRLGSHAKTDRAAPYARRLTMPASAKRGGTVTVVAAAFLELRGGAHKTASVGIAVPICA